MNQRYHKLSFLIAACLLLAAGAYFWATTLMDSLDSYESPLQTNPPAPGNPVGNALSQRVVFVLIDGLREDTSMDASVMPFLNRLRSQGAWATMHSQPASYSAPGYSVLFTGTWPELSSGPALNKEYEDLNPLTQETLAAALHRAGRTTAVSGYNWFEKLIPQQYVTTSFYTPGYDRAADEEVVDAALPWLESGEYDFVFIHLDQVDYAGHYEGGPLDPRWNEAAARSDALLQEIAEQLDLTQDTILVCSDHGHIDLGGHGGHDPVTLLEPLVLAGAGVVPGEYPDVQMVDVAPTIAALLGAGIPASSQGQVLTMMLDFSGEELQALQAAAADQQRQLADAYFTAIGSTAVVQPGGDPVSAHQEAMKDARDTRLQSERLPRLGLAVSILVSLALLLKRMWKRDLAWLFAGGAGTLILFNLRYVVLDGLPYSLSWVLGVQEMILYVAGTSIGSFALAWILLALVRRVFQSGPLEAAQWTLSLALASAAWLLLPVLWSFVQNGILVRWALPDFPSLYHGFIALLQILSITAGGLLLAGTAAVIGKATGKKRAQRS